MWHYCVVYFFSSFFLLEIIVMTSKKIINAKTTFEQLQLLLTDEY